MTHLLHLLVNSNGVRVAAGINGVVLAQDRRGESYYTRSPLNEWMRPTRNRLEFEVYPVDPPLSDAPPSFEIAICHPEDTPGPIARFEWKGTRGELVEPFRISLPFSLPMPCPTKLWTEAERIEPDDEKSIEAAVLAAREAYEAFASRDIDRILESLAYRIEDNARAWLDDPASDIEGARAAYGSLVKPDEFSLKPWENVEARLIADGLVVHVFRQGGFPLIASIPRPGVAPGALDIYVARIDGRWRVVR